MNYRTALAAALLVPTAAAAQDTIADLDTSVRCAVLFGFVGGMQSQGPGVAREFPPMEPRGQEFFVQSMARLYDEQGLTRDQVAERVRSELSRIVADLNAESNRDAALRARMAPCLVLLDATIPAAPLPPPR